MDLRQLNNFVTVAETGSISAAARQEHVAQPPLSRQMTALEEELGVSLFIRTNQGVLLTEAGEEFYHQCRHILAGLEQMKASVQDIGKGVVGQLRIGLLYSISPLVRSYALSYHAAYPDVKLHVRFGTPHELLDALYKAELDIVFLRSPVKIPREMASVELGTDELVLIMTPELDPAPDQSFVTIDQLRMLPFCLLEHNEQSGYNDYLLRACARNGFYPKTVAYGRDAHTLVQMAAAGMGVAYLPGSVLESEVCRMHGMYAKGIEGLQVFSPVSMIWDDTPVTSHCVRVFAENISTQVQKNRVKGEYYEIKHS